MQFSPFIFLHFTIIFGNIYNKHQFIKMNIGIFTNHEINPFIGGVEKVTYNLSIYLKSKGFKLFFFHLYGKNKDNHFIIPSTSNIQLITSFIDSKITENKIDIIIDQYGTGNYFTHINLKSKVKIIRCWHLNIFEKNITYCLLGAFWYKKISENLKNFCFWINTPRRRAKYLAEYKLAIEQTDIFCTLSEAYRKQLVNIYKKNNIISINNAIKVLPKVSLLEKENIIMFCGRIVHNPKNVLFLINLWEQLFLKYPDWKMILVGDGEDRYILEKLIKKKKLQRIFITGYTNPNDYYQKAKILVLPSYNEGFGMVLIEAMSHGCVPIVFNTSPAFHDIITDANNGYIVNNLNKKEYINKCQLLMENDKQLKQMAINATSSVKKFSLEIIGEQWINLFNTLLKK